MEHRPVLIGIAGPSAAGKSTASEILQKKLRQATLISVDNYWKDPAGFPPVRGVRKLEGYKIWDHPENINFDLLYKNLSELKRGEATTIPIRIPDPVHNIVQMRIIEPKEIVIVEGMLLFYEERIRSLFDMCIYLDIPEKISVERRIKRKRAAGESNELYYRKVVAPSFRQYGQPTKLFAHKIIDATKPLQETVAAMLGHIKHLFDPFIHHPARRARTRATAAKRAEKPAPDKH